MVNETRDGQSTDLSDLVNSNEKRIEELNKNIDFDIYMIIGTSMLSTMGMFTTLLAFFAEDYFISGVGAAGTAAIAYFGDIACTDLKKNIDYYYHGRKLRK